MTSADQDADTAAASFLVDKMISWIETNLTVAKASPLKQSSQATPDDVQELEEEQEVQEVEMFGESDAYDPLNLIKDEAVTGAEEQQSSSQSLVKWCDEEEDEACKQRMDELLRLATSASFFFNQQKLNACASQGASGLSLLLDNQYLVHLLAINKTENVFRVKQIHDYYGGCFICGKQVDFNMKHYQVFFFILNSHYPIASSKICLKLRDCNEKS